MRIPMIPMIPTLLCFLASHSMAWGADPLLERQAQAKRATLFVEAQQYESARTIYESLLNTNPQPWEKAILNYNLGVIDIAERRWLQALREFNAVNVSADTPPWLIGRLETNRAIAYIERIQELLTYVLPEAKQPNEVIDQLQQLVTKTRNVLTAAQAANCQAVEAGSCSMTPDLNEFQRVLKSLEADIESKFDTQRVANLPPVDLLGTLLASLKSDRRQVDVLAEDNIHAFLESRTAQRSPYWSALRGHLALPFAIEDSLQHTDSRTATTAAIDEVITTLNQLFLELIPLNQPFVQGIARLRLDYAELLGAELSFAAAQSIQESYHKLAVGTPAGVSERLIYAKTAHQYGMQVLKKDDPSMARLFFGVAALWADLAMQTAPDRESGSPSDLLKALISLQESVNVITRQAQALTVDPSTFTEALRQVVDQIQKAAIRFSTSFQNSVSIQEQKLYAAGECQEGPWNLVMPDFFEGHAEVSLAANDLGSVPPNWGLVRERQQRGISLWRRAWHELQQPKTPSGSPQESEQINPLPAEPQTKQLPLSETIRFLQQMESEDRPMRTSGTRENGVLRPW